MRDLLLAKTREVEDIIYPYFNLEREITESLREPMEYSLKAGGKRLRPMLMREASLLYSKNPNTLPLFMAAIEMIHTYSLVHDDLPDMDNDELRHGKMSTHRKFGSAMGILCGDALLNYAYELVFKAISMGEDISVIKAGQILANSAGALGMVGGQSLDVLSDKTGINLGEKEILYIYENKTGKLISAALKIGGVLAHASERDIERLEKIGINVGFAFQIQDDILDIEGDETVLGKPIGSDISNNKKTYVEIFGMDKSKSMVKSLTQEALEILYDLPCNSNFLCNLFDYLIKREK